MVNKVCRSAIFNQFDLKMFRLFPFHNSLLPSEAYIYIWALNRHIQGSHRDPEMILAHFYTILKLWTSFICRLQSRNGPATCFWASEVRAHCVAQGRPYKRQCMCPGISATDELLCIYIFVYNKWNFSRLTLLFLRTEISVIYDDV